MRWRRYVCWLVGHVPLKATFNPGLGRPVRYWLLGKCRYCHCPLNGGLSTQLTEDEWAKIR